MVKVSVIIPIYNTEQYLTECLDSIINQTLKDVEIICIDDGSTDNSLEILESYAKKDSRIKIISQKNQGQAVARNNALKHVAGKYVTFVDSDDLLELNTLEKCYEICEEKYLDLLMFKLINYDDTKDNFYNTPLYDMHVVSNKVKNQVFNYEDLNEKIFNISITPVNKLYKTEFIKSNNAHFPEGTIFEDNIFSWNLIFKAKRMFFLDEYFYIRRIHPNSTTSIGDAKWVDAIEIYNKVWKIFQENNEFENYKKKLYNNKIIFALYRLDHIKNEYKDLFFSAWQKDLIKIQKEYIDFSDYLNIENKKIFQYVLTASNYNDFTLFRNINEISNNLKIFDYNYKRLNDDFNNLVDDYNSISLRNDFLLKNIEKIKKEQMLLDKTNDRLREEIMILKAKNDDLLNFKENVLSSESWKITEPIRKLVKLLK